MARLYWPTSEYLEKWLGKFFAKKISSGPHSGARILDNLDLGVTLYRVCNVSLGWMEKAVKYTESRNLLEHSNCLYPKLSLYFIAGS